MTRGRIFKGILCNLTAVLVATLYICEPVSAVTDMGQEDGSFASYDMMSDESSLFVLPDDPEPVQEDSSSVSEDAVTDPADDELLINETEELPLVLEDETEGSAICLAGEQAEGTSPLLSDEAKQAFKDIVDSKTLMALVYLTDECRVYEYPDTSSKVIATLSEGHTLYIHDIETTYGDRSDDTPGNSEKSSSSLFADGMENGSKEQSPSLCIMYKVSFFKDGSEYTGYVKADNLVYSDEDWIAWEREYLAGRDIVPDSEISAFALDEINTSTDIISEPSEGAYEDIARFPASYQDKLTALKNAHPNWVFVPLNTGLDFSSAVSNEMGDKSWIYINDSNTSKGWVGNATGQGKWAYATSSAVSYHMDPRNFFTESYIFQFEQLTFNSSYHTVEAVQNFLNGTFMKGVIPDDSITYAQAFYNLGSSKKISPTHLASRVYQEQGKGTSPLISGTYSGYEGYYNYFNVGATGKTDTEVIKNGLEYARSKGWNTRYKSLDGGADTIGKNYILKGQDTSYLQKFNVNPAASSAVYTHQYMQNIQAPSSESASTKKIYEQAGSLNSPFVFKIPVFTGMSDDKKEDPKPEEPKILTFKVAPIEDAVYTGSAIKPVVTVYDEPTDGALPVTLILNRDYTVSYKNNTNANDPNAAESKRPVVVVTGKGNYSGTKNAYFNILPTTFSAAGMHSEDVSLAYNGKEQRGTPVVRSAGKTLKNGVDYTLEYPDTADGAYKENGRWTIRITGKGNYSNAARDSLTAYEVISSKTLISKASIKVKNIAYDKSVIIAGKGMEPEVTVKYKGEDLILSTDGGKSGDYTLEYADNTDIGTATVTVRATENGSFAGSKTLRFKVTGISIGKATVSGLNKVTYTGDEKDVKQKDYVLSLKDETVLKGIEEEAYEALGASAKLPYDYTVSYKNTDKPGSAKIIFKGVNAYSGSMTKSYRIEQVPLVDLYSQYRNGSAANGLILKYYTEKDAAAHGVSIQKNGTAPSEEYLKSKGVTVKQIKSLEEITDDYVKGGSRPQIIVYFAGAQLDDKSYSVSYRNINAVTLADTPEEKKPVITVKGKGCLKGSISGSFRIDDGDFANENKVDITVNDVVFSGRKNSWKASVTITDANGSKLSAGKDYDKNVVYTYASDAVNVHDATGSEITRKSGDTVEAGDIPGAGTYIKATVTGKGYYDDIPAGAQAGYEGKPVTRSATYRIVAVNIGSSKVKAKVADKYYLNGKEVVLDPAKDITLTCGTVTLEYGKDYVLDDSTYRNNINKGKATVIIRAVDRTKEGNTDFGGIRKLTFNIKQRRF